MAIDTAAKRFSIMDADLPTQPGMVPPDGTIDVGARLALLWLYGGIVPEWTGELAATIPNFASGLAGAYGPTAALAATVPNFTSGLSGIGGVIAPATFDAGGGMPQYSRGERRRRGLEWDKPRKIEELVEEAYRAIAGELVEAVNEPGTVREAIAPFTQSSDAAIPPPEAVDFAALGADLMRAEMVLQAYEAALRAKAELDDEEDAIVALLLA